MSSQIRVREYILGDEKNIIDLLKEVFKDWPRLEIPCFAYYHWKWKYIDNPKKTNAISVAIDEDKIIGCDHGYYIDIKIGEKVFLGYQGGDSAVHPEYQGQGIYSQLNYVKYHLIQMKVCDFAYWATDNPKMIKFNRNRKYPRFPKVQNMIKIKDVDLHRKFSPVDQWVFKKYAYKTLKNINKFINVYKNYKI